MTELRRSGDGSVPDDVFNELVDHVEANPGGGLPAGGTTGQVLTKESDTDGDAGWEDSGGGSQPVEWIALPVAFDTAGLTSTNGIPLGYTAAVGDMLLFAGPSIPTTAFDGTAPYLSLFTIGFDPWSNAVGLFNMDTIDNDANANGWGIPVNTIQAGTVVCNTAGALRLKLLNNNDGSDPGSTHGEALFIVNIGKVTP